ncbi:hypothetical protein Fmac_021029 [Flemingia macrophylla]|uniref:Uncharacterized protein n=1 Tax=Flemingia macrophylla TaxID=520843 RepID=A0ABD1LVY0_9FABA
MMLTCLATAEVLKKETEEANEEQVLVKLARIKALKELAYIEAQAEIDVTRGRGHKRNGDRRGDLNATAGGGRSGYGR